MTYSLPYELIDSGDGARLERFGDRVLIRPSKFSVWKRRNPAAWSKAHAEFDHKKGWRFFGEKFGEWEVRGKDATLILRLQENGQIGLFPEHLSYLDELQQAVRTLKEKSEEVRVLNLFAYTGVASIVAAKGGATVTHVDLSKKVLEWASENFKRNDLTGIRFIKEDALTFVERELRRGNTYHIIIADPPSFSRISPKEEWTLETVLSSFIRDLAKLLVPQHHALFLTSHHFESGGMVMANLLLDSLNDGESEVRSRELAIKEHATERRLPAGFLVVVS